MLNHAAELFNLFLKSGHSELFRASMLLLSYVFFLLASWPRDKKSSFSGSLALWSVAQIAVLFLLTQNHRVIVWVVGVELIAWMYSQMEKALFEKRPSRSMVMRLSHMLSLVAVLIVAAKFPYATWHELSIISADPAETVANPARLVFGMVVFQLVLRSGFLYSPGSSPTTGRHKLFELCGLGIPSLLLGWDLFEGSEMALPTAFGEVGILLGILVFVVFQWIAFSRHFIADFTACMCSSYAALFWSTLLLYSHGFGSTDVLFALCWGGLFSLLGLLIFLSWMEEERGLVRERSIRGLFQSNPAAAIPAMFFVLGLAGQPWLLAGTFRFESGAMLVKAGASFAVALFFGWLLQSSKSLHIGLSFLIPNRENGSVLELRNSKLLLLWTLAVVCVGFGTMPGYFRALFQP